MSRTYERERPSDGQHKRTPSSNTPAGDQAELEALQQAVGNRGMSQLLDPASSEVIESRLGGGKPMDQAAPVPADAKGAAREARLHDDAASGELAKQMGAVAFTFGKDVFLASDAPDLASAEGQRVLRHELTHVEQFDDTELGRPRGVSDPEGAAEQEAAHVADSAAASHASASTAAVHRQEMPEEEPLLAQMPAETVHRQDEEEEGEEIVATMPAETVHRQEMPEEEEAAQMMPAETVHRQIEEEEEPIHLMPTETVHRQMDDEEAEMYEGEAAQMMPAETVHRQVEEEEEEAPIQAMPAETVHRDDEEEVEQEAAEPAEAAEEEAAEPANPALAALWNASVLAKIMQASENMGADPPDAEAALAAVEEAQDSVHSLIPVYEERDPLLRQRLGRSLNGLIGLGIALAPLAGRGTTSPDWVRTSLAISIENNAELGTMLH